MTDPLDKTPAAIVQAAATLGEYFDKQDVSYWKLGRVAQTLLKFANTIAPVAVTAFMLHNET